LAAFYITTNTAGVNISRGPDSWCITAGPVNRAIGLLAVGPSGTKVRIRGSDFESGAQASFGAFATVVTAVDGTTLSATVPSLPTGPVWVTVTNPDGKQYSFRRCIRR
jgi:hypothetical protein